MMWRAQLKRIFGRTGARRAGLLVVLVLLPALGWAHCDSLAGPVVQDARRALEEKDVSPVLKWVAPAQEAEVRQAFKQALVVRDLGDDARLLADRYFFETLVRIHRAGEGEAFTGLKSGDETDPGIAAADLALASGSPDELAQRTASSIEEGVRKRFAAVARLRKQADESVEAGRAYVRAYVDYIHFVETAQRLASEGAPHLHHEPAQ